jgi:hypothetical protein
MMVFLKQTRSRRGPALRQHTGFSQSRFFIQVSKYFPDHRRVFNTGDDFNRATAFAAGFDIEL